MYVLDVKGMDGKRSTTTETIEKTLNVGHGNACHFEVLHCILLALLNFPASYT
jgi:hypothetical protein